MMNLTVLYSSFQKKKKVFDVIDHNLFLKKLALYGMSDSFMELYFNNRQQCINVVTRKSSLSTLMYGIPQASVLGPISFSLYINDLPLHIAALLLICIDKLIDWTETNHMNLHPDKTKFMPITTRQKRKICCISFAFDRKRQHH